MAEETPTLPTDEPTSLTTVKAWIGIDDETDDSVLGLIVDTVCEQVRGLPVAERAIGLERWPAKVRQGATMLAARLWRRRKTPGGVEALGDFGVAYVRRNDPDIASLLELGEQARPAVG